jgi:signal transduction histidine kinase
MAELRENGALKIRQFDMTRLMNGCSQYLNSRCCNKQVSHMWVGRIAGQYAGDEVRLRQCFVNLIDNAVKFSKNGGRVIVDIRQKKSGKNTQEDKFMIRITDNGIGMSEEQMENMYRPFVKNQNLVTTADASSGIGLTVTKMIVDAMDGNIEVCSELEYGTTVMVTFSLPRIRKTENEIDNSDARMYTFI